MFQARVRAAGLRGARGGGQVAPHLPLRAHQLLLQQPRPAQTQPGVHRCEVTDIFQILKIAKYEN